MGRSPLERGAAAAGRAVEETRRLGLTKEKVLDHFLGEGLDGALNAARNAYGDEEVAEVVKAQYALGWVMSMTEMKWQMHQAVYDALERSYRELCTPGRSALVIPLAQYALTVPTTLASLRESLIWLAQVGRIQVRRMNYPVDVPEMWEVIFPGLRNAC